MALFAAYWEELWDNIQKITLLHILKEQYRIKSTLSIIIQGVKMLRIVKWFIDSKEINFTDIKTDRLADNTSYFEFKCDSLRM